MERIAERHLLYKRGMINWCLRSKAIGMVSISSSDLTISFVTGLYFKNGVLTTVICPHLHWQLQSGISQIDDRIAIKNLIGTLSVPAY